MRRQHKITSTAANLLASKRIAIAFCAAVAMVLGAMSVGATMHFYPSAPTPDGMPSSVAEADFGTTQHANTTTVTSSNTSNSVSPTIIENKGLKVQNKLTPILVSPPKNQKDKKDIPLLVVPNIVSQTSLTLGPLSVSADLSNDSVQLNTTLTPPVTVSVPTTLQNILPSNDPSSTPSTGSTGSTGTSTDTTNQGSANNAPTNQAPSSPSLLSPLDNIISPTSNNAPSVATTTTPN